jgi:hypothetical protein
MKPRVDVAVVAEEQPDGRFEIFLFDPKDGRQARTGYKVPKEEKAQAVQHFAAAARRNGLRVTVRTC